MSPRFFELLGDAYDFHAAVDNFDLDRDNPESVVQFAALEEEQATACRALIALCREPDWDE